MKLDQALEKKIVSSIATMDRRMLDVLLPDNGVYDDTYKEVWLSKLDVIYDECKQAGDETLAVYERICSKDDDPLYGQQTYIFCAPAAKWCLMLGFVVKNGEFVGLKQYFGYKQLLKEKLFDPTHRIEIGMDIYPNEEIGYVETKEHREHKAALIEFELEMKNDRRKVIGRKWLLGTFQVYYWLYQETMFDQHCEEVVRFQVMMTDFYNLYCFMRKPSGYVNLYNKYKALVGKEDKVSALKRRRLIANNMLMLFSFCTSRNFCINDNGEFIYSYKINSKRYSLKVHFRDTRIEAPGYFPLIKESHDVIDHFFEAYKRNFSNEIVVYAIEDVIAFYKGKFDGVLKEMDV
ncbi:MAG TPA: hypothetical protein VK169_17135 [Saprospiraceae bacterium]|nr:hypothetical protein [Saprospiraceae bacterium]